MTQQIQQPIIIDSNTDQTTETLLNIITELKDILQSSIKALSPEMTHCE
jgi:hypothetical protein